MRWSQLNKLEYKKLTEKVKASSFTDYRSYLNFIYETIKANNSAYSFIKFTEDLGLGSSNLMYHYLKGKRPLTIKTARKIATALGLMGLERKYFLTQVEYQIAKKNEQRQQSFQKLLETKASCLSGQFDKNQLEFFKHWYHIAIFELLRLEGAKDDPNWIAKQLKPNISAQKAEESLKLLEKLQMISFDESRNRLYPSVTNISTGREIRGLVFKSCHNQMIGLAAKALSSEKATSRDISGVTLSLPTEAWEELKELTSEFRQKLLQLADKHTNKQEIVQVNIQAFSLSEKTTKDLSSQRKDK